MIDVMFLQSFGFVGGNIGALLAQWEQLGVFSYVLPFLLIFALIFGVLSRVQIFKDNKAVNSVIALSVSLMSLQFGFVPIFFSQIFPRLGVGLSVILIGLILIGLFTDTNRTPFFFGLGIIVFIIVVWNSFDFGTMPFGFWLSQNWGSALLAIVVIVFLIAIISPIKPDWKHDNLLAKALTGDSGH
jgi:hypothetical protein